MSFSHTIMKKKIVVELLIPKNNAESRRHKKFHRYLPPTLTTLPAKKEVYFLPSINNKNKAYKNSGESNLLGKIRNSQSLDAT